MGQPTFYEGSNSEYFWFSYPYGLCHNYSSAVVRSVKVAIERICKQMEMSIFQQILFTKTVSELSEL